MFANYFKVSGMNIRNRLFFLLTVALFFSVSAHAQLTPVADVESFRQRLLENKQFATIACEFTQYHVEIELLNRDKELKNP